MKLEGNCVKVKIVFCHRHPSSRLSTYIPPFHFNLFSSTSPIPGQFFPVACSRFPNNLCSDEILLLLLVSLGSSVFFPKKGMWACRWNLLKMIYSTVFSPLQSFHFAPASCNHVAAFSCHFTCSPALRWMSVQAYVLSFSCTPRESGIQLQTKLLLGRWRCKVIPRLHIKYTRHKAIFTKLRNIQLPPAALPVIILSRIAI